MMSKPPEASESKLPDLSSHDEAAEHPADQTRSDQSQEDEGKEKDEGSFQRTEMTVEGILGFFEKYARTYGLMALPCKPARSILLDTTDKKRRLPPLMFLSISAFLFAFVIDSLMATEISMSPNSVFKSLSQRVSPDTSITGIVFSAMPVIIFVVGAGFLISRFLLAGDAKRQKFFAFFCYVFGFYAASIFLLFILINAALLIDERAAEGSAAVTVTNIIGFFSLLGFVYVIIQPVFALCYGLWKIDVDKSTRLRILKVLGLLALHPVLLFASVWTETLPHKFNNIISVQTRPEIFLVQSRDDKATMVAGPDGASSDVELTFTIGIRNSTDDQLALNKDDDNSLLAWGLTAFGIGMGSTEFQDARAKRAGLTVVSLSEKSGPDNPLIIVDSGEIKWLRCAARIPVSAYQPLKAAKVLSLRLSLPFTTLKSKSAERKYDLAQSDIIQSFRIPELSTPTPTPADGTR